jgi:hypothetical protein
MSTSLMLFLLMADDVVLARLSVITFIAFPGFAAMYSLHVYVEVVVSL